MKSFLRYIPIFLAALCVVAAMCSCTGKDGQIACTMEFRTITIRVNRDALQQFYTIRQSTGDTIRPGISNVFGEKTYPVLDDTYQSRLAGQTDTFLFQGYINNVRVVNEPFVIRADQCHIEYVSGNTVIN